MAIADGHGSEKSPKSASGAEIAARRALEQLREFATGVDDKPLDVIKRHAEQELPRRLVKGWIDDVRSREPAREDLPTLLYEYGTTLLAVLVTERYILYLQLGDGDILRVMSDYSVDRPVPTNPAHFANETTSLSMVDKHTGQPNAWVEMAVVLEPLSEARPGPELIVVSTDGYANSFSSEEGFLQVGSDILRMIRTEGWERVRDNLRTWLNDATNSGSGDDIAVGLLWNSRNRGSEGVHHP